MDSFQAAQEDMQSAYLNGIPGVVTSGTVWIIAATVAFVGNPIAGIATLIFGGSAIFPVSVLLCKVLGRSGKHDRNNPLAPLAIEGTVWMLLSIPIAIGIAFHKIEWFFPAMMLVIAGRYLTFKTLYGFRIFWLFSLALVLASIACILLKAPVYIGALSGGLVEIIFAVLLYIFTRKSD